MTHEDRSALEAMYLFGLQHVLCADHGEDPTVARTYENSEHESVTIRARCSKCGSVDGYRDA